MNIIIKQKEIEAGIKLYLLQQGIQLNGKSTEISFTAGRKDSGLSAEIEINDAEGVASAVDTMIQQQAPVAPVVVVPEVQTIPAVVHSVNVPVVASLATELVAEPVPAEVLIKPATEIPQAPQVGTAADAAVKAAVDALFAAPADEDRLEDGPVAEVAAVNAPWEDDEVEAPVAAPAVKTVSLFS